MRKTLQEIIMIFWVRAGIKDIKTLENHVRFQILIVASVKMTALWDIVP
jgi:hypothetical protein